MRVVRPDRVLVVAVLREAAGHYGAPFLGEGGHNSGVGPLHSIDTAGDYFNGRKTSIYGGSNEIQRNIIAKMVLGL